MADMTTRRTLLALAAFLALAHSPVHAGEAVPFTRAAFEAAQKSGKPILIEISADWCPTCKAQQPIIDGLVGNGKFKDLVAFRVDFDAQKDEVRAFGAQMQSTLIAFRGASETGRSVGDTNPASIEKLLDSAI